MLFSQIIFTSVQIWSLIELPSWPTLSSSMSVEMQLYLFELFLGNELGYDKKIGC